MNYFLLANGVLARLIVDQAAASHHGVLFNQRERENDAVRDHDRHPEEVRDGSLPHRTYELPATASCDFHHASESL